MNKPTVNQITKDFLEYFEARNHTIVPSAPLLPEDPTLLFTAAGMVPFKSYYSDPDRAPYQRAASVQKCLRAGGKQSDLENVGRTLRHHTFFEMLGNFSFGDYFKKEAIEWGWDLSVEVWKLDPERIWVSIFEDDDEAYDLWTNHVGFAKDRIVRRGRKDNFWGPVGDTGVCGPSSEMHYDTGRPGPDGGPTDESGDRFIEYWNLVFPQFFYTDAGKYDLLPRPGIDTGLGLERLAFILQDVKDNFHTDEFLPIRNAVAAAFPDPNGDDAALAINAASDHVRALTFALAEGIMPSNEGRGYVLRRLLRRALTKVHPFGVREPFLASAVDAVIKKMKVRYPELQNRGALIKEMITAEEVRFLDTLEQGMSRLETLFDATSAKGTLGGADVFQLYDTFGFPPELTAELAEERGINVDHAGFESAMSQQKDRGRSHASFRDGVNVTDKVFVRVSSGANPVPSTTEFIGYDELHCDANAAGVRMRGENQIELTTDRTVFYPQGGGQVGDAGRMKFGERSLQVVDTYRVGGEISHLIAWDKGDPEKVFTDNPSGSMDVDRERRRATERNHTATHLLHAALREVLGDHVAQAGSLVDPNRLRFDFNHFAAMKPEEVAAVEKIVNDSIMTDMKIGTENMAYDDAVAAGAMALFGEKYGDTVRVVTIGDFSRELCGGTHLGHTGEIGPFFVRQEGAVGSGVRRVEALTGSGALSYVGELLDERHRIAALLKVGPDDVERRVRGILEDAEHMQRQLKKEGAQRAKDQTGDAISHASDIAGISYVAIKVDAPDVPALRSFGDALRGKMDLGVGVICQDKPENPVCLIVVSDRMIKERSLKAGDIAGRIADQLGFRGGGKPHMAQVGLPGIEEFDKVDTVVKETLESLA